MQNHRTESAFCLLALAKTAKYSHRCSLTTGSTILHFSLLDPPNTCICFRSAEFVKPAKLRVSGCDSVEGWQANKHPPTWGGSDIKPPLHSSHSRRGRSPPGARHRPQPWNSHQCCCGCPFELLSRFSLRSFMFPRFKKQTKWGVLAVKYSVGCFSPLLWCKNVALTWKYNS